MSYRQNQILTSTDYPKPVSGSSGMSHREQIISVHNVSYSWVDTAIKKIREEVKHGKQKVKKPKKRIYWQEARDFIVNNLSIGDYINASTLFRNTMASKRLAMNYTSTLCRSGYLKRVSFGQYQIVKSIPADLPYKKIKPSK
jgi:hypothetical protein